MRFDMDKMALTDEDLRNQNNLTEAAHRKYAALLDEYFTLSDYGNSYISQEGQTHIVMLLCKDSKQAGNIARFLEIADAELAKRELLPLETRGM